MSAFSSMLVHRVDILTPGTGTDRYGSTVKDWAAPVTVSNVPAWVHQRATGENKNGREARVSSWVAFLGPSVNIAALDRIVFNGRTFEVDGDPVPADDMNGAHHIEAPLRIVEG